MPAAARLGRLGAAAAALCGVPALAGPAAPPHFATEVLPVLTRAGCNAGACHGAATGRGGFRLSLLGYDPAADHSAIAREFSGRRLDIAGPEQSLLLKKAAAAVTHGGGRRLRPDDASHALLVRWIAAGAPAGDPGLRVDALRAEPPELVLDGQGARGRLRVVARLSSGAQRDVSAVALADCNDEGIAGLEDGPVLAARRPGVTAVMLRFGGAVAAARVIVPQPGALPAGAVPVGKTPIDRALFSGLARVRIDPSPPIDDLHFLRRASLDLAGTLPDPGETRAWAAAPGRDPARRAALVDRLLASREAVDHWTYRLADLLLIDSRRLGKEGAAAYHAWLRAQVEQDRPLDAVIREALAARGAPSSAGAAAFHRLATDPRDMAEWFGRTLLGARIACARCHSHPFDRWTQDDHYAFSALFARVRVENGAVVTAPRGDLDHPRTGLPVLPRPLLGAAPVDPEADRTAALSAWLEGPGRRMLATALANRVWRWVFGRGIVEPVDDLRPTNPPANPALLSAATDALLECGFRLRAFARLLALTDAYALSALPTERNRTDDRLFSRAVQRALEPVVLADAVARATGVPLEFPEYPAGARAAELVDARTPSTPLEIFGRCRRDAACEEEPAGGGLAMALHLINGETLNERVGAVPAALLAEGKPDGAIIEELYLRALARHPEPEERRRWLEEGGGNPDRRRFFEDLFWALLSSREFTHRH